MVLLGAWTPDRNQDYTWASEFSMYWNSWSNEMYVWRHFFLGRGRGKCNQHSYLGQEQSNRSWSHKNDICLHHQYCTYLHLCFSKIPLSKLRKIEVAKSNDTRRFRPNGSPQWNDFLSIMQCASGVLVNTVLVEWSTLFRFDEISLTFLPEF
jgi:hypothetical protein